MLEQLRQNRLVKSVVVAAALHGAVGASQTESVRDIAAATFELAKGIQLKVRGAIGAIVNTSREGMHRADQQQMLNDLRDQINLATPNLGRNLIRADGLEYTPDADNERQNAEAMQAYNALLTQVQDLVHKHNVPLWDAIPRVTGHLQYDRGQVSMRKFLTQHRGKCFPTALTNASLAVDSGMRSVYLRFYARDPNSSSLSGHVTAVIRFTDGQEMDLNAGTWALPGGVSVPYTAIPELYAAQHGLPYDYEGWLIPYAPEPDGQTAMIAGPEVPADQFYPDPGVYYAPHAIEVFRNINTEEIRSRRAPTTTEHRNERMQGSSSDITERLLEFQLELAKRVQQRSDLQQAVNSGNLLYFDTTPFTPSPSSASEQTQPVISTEVAEINRLLSQQTRQANNLQGDAVLFANARLIGLHSMLQDRLAVETHNPENTRMRAFSEAESTRLRQLVANQINQFNISGQQRALRIGDASELQWADLANIGEDGVRILAERSSYFHGQNPDYFGSAHMDSNEQIRADMQAKADLVLLINPLTRNEIETVLSALSTQELLAEIDAMLVNMNEDLNEDLKSEVSALFAQSTSRFARMFRMQLSTESIDYFSERVGEDMYGRGLDRSFEGVEQRIQARFLRERLPNQDIPLYRNRFARQRILEIGKREVESSFRDATFQYLLAYRRFVQTHHLNDAVAMNIVHAIDLISSPQYREGINAWLNGDEDQDSDIRSGMIDELIPLEDALRQIGF